MVRSNDIPEGRHVDVLDRILQLVSNALDDLDNPACKLSGSIRKAIRIARLRNNYDNLWWLEYEMIAWENKDAKRRIDQELLPYYTKTQFEALQIRIVTAYVDERKCRRVDDHGELVDKGDIRAMGVEELESLAESLEKGAAAAIPPAGLHPVDLYHVDQAKTQLRATLSALAQDSRAILARIRQRVHAFLSTTETHLIYGQLNTDIFEQNRQFVDARLHDIAPDAFEKLTVVYRRLGEGNPEARSHALTSCRRILKALADKVYPATSKPVQGIDGQERRLTDEKFVARLWQFVAERVRGKTSGELLLAEINDLGGRIDRVYELSCKGVHTDVSDFEVNQCVIQTYLVIGDILRLYDHNSALESKDTDA
jgi:hypothetical protein